MRPSTRCALTLAVILFVLLFVPVARPAWAVNLPLGQTQTGSIATAAQSNSYTFTANANDVVTFTATTTSGSLSPKVCLYGTTGTQLSCVEDLSFGSCNGGATVEMPPIMLPTTPPSGTYTVILSDCVGTNTGNYAFYGQRTNNPSGAANLPFGGTEAGTITLAAQSNSYTFSANANDVVDLTMTTTSGTLSPKIRLYNPNGTLLSTAEDLSFGSCNGASTVEMDTITLATTGTYTVLVGDCSDTNSGNYEIYAQRTDNPNGPGLLLGQTQTGAIGESAQSNNYTFTANANDVVILTATTTSGTLSPKLRLYSPLGALLSTAEDLSFGSCNGAGTVEMSPVTLTASGVYTVLVGDCSDTNIGNYNVYSQRTNNPTGAAALPFGGTETGLIGSAAQSNSYTFSANANDVVDFTAVTTTGTLSPKLRLYTPAGALLATADDLSFGSCNGAATVEMNTITLPATGVYTLLVGDCPDTNTGNYSIYGQRTNNPAGPVLVLWGLVQPATIASAAQSNTYAFTGFANNTVDFTIVTTSGKLSPKIRLYNPDGSLLASAQDLSFGSCNGGATVQLNSITLVQTGTYTALVGDCSDTNTGNYNLSSQCFGTCPTQAATPTFSPKAGRYTSAQSVAIMDATTGSAIYYTTNGSTPTTSSTLYSGAITVSATETIKAIAVLAGYQNSAIGVAKYIIAAANPVFSPKAGKYTSAQSVTITDATTGAVIYYTTDGSTPTTKSTVYNGAITVSASQTIKAVAVAKGFANSTVVSAAYIIVAATPVISPKAGKYKSPQSVTITDTTTGAVIYYTTDGTTPTTKSTQYGGAITVSTNTTIEAIAVAPGYSNSAAAKAIYTIVAATPVFSPKAGKYASAQSVTITDSTTGAVIYYTTDGTTPTSKSNQYAGALTVSATETIKAIAVATDYANSTVATAIYTIE